MSGSHRDQGIPTGSRYTSSMRVPRLRVKAMRKRVADYVGRHPGCQLRDLYTRHAWSVAQAAQVVEAMVRDGALRCEDEGRLYRGDG